MKAHVYVTLKTSVLDPQGQTIHNALRKIGFADVTAVRQGNIFALSLADGLTPKPLAPRSSASPAKSSTNPVIEESPTASRSSRAFSSPFAPIPIAFSLPCRDAM